MGQRTQPIVLDITRSLSPKSIETPTGIDRVERAYISHFLRSDREAYFVSRRGRSVSLIDRMQMQEVFERLLDGGPRPLRQDLWQLIKQVVGLTPALRFPGRFTYINVGHSNIDRAWLTSLRRMGAEKTVGLVHDMIPLDHPNYQTPTSVVRFEGRMRALAADADLIVTNSEYTLGRVADWFGRWGTVPEIVVKPLGVERPPAGPTKAFPRPAFVVLGTIEPRKNHSLLLDVWEGLRDLPESERPELHIIGRRGWMNEETFARLDRSPLMGQDIFEHNNLTDQEVTSYLRGADALLFPSLVEGYGLPILEAYCVGTPTIASDIEAFQPFSGAVSLYLNPFDATVWRKAIIEKSKQGQNRAALEVDEQFLLPTWDRHFALLEAQI